MKERPWLVSLSALVLLGTGSAQKEPDRDGDGLSDFAEIHKYLTDPGKADSDGDGVPDGDWRERREYQYTVRTIVQVMRPVTIDFLCDDHQDARVLDETADYVELEVIHYPFTTVASAITADAAWRRTTASMKGWTAPGPTANWTPAMQKQLFAALGKDGIDAAKLDDKTLVERASHWLCEHARYNDSFTTFVTAFDAKGKPFVPDELAAVIGRDAATWAKQWQCDISAAGMFEQGQRGSCSSSSIYLNGCLRALGVPTRIVLCIPIVDANDAGELALLDKGLTHRQLRSTVLPAIAAQKGSWSSHSFNEVFVGGRWRRLNYDKLGQDIADPNLFGMITHIATFSDWADARMPETIGRRQTLRRYDDVFGGPNPYSTITLRDEFGPHCNLENEAPAPLVGKVTSVLWGDGADTPGEIREWFKDRGVFGLIARVEGPSSFAELKRLLADADLRVLLAAVGKPTLGVGFDAGHYWWKGDHGLVVVPFGGADRRDLDEASTYRFVARNQGTGSHWQVAEGLVVPSRR
ncbi:MAG TPA: transglutaminase domain-containing protein [Planctomycetota bacterium]|nr:transglutaminase domain-containing protein [Planctomycetota bacterium]